MKIFWIAYFLSRWRTWNELNRMHLCFTLKIMVASVTSVVSNSVWSHRRQPTRLPRPCDSPGKNTGVGCRFLLQCMKVKSEGKSLNRVRLFATPWTAAYQAPLSMGFSRQRVLEWGAIAFSWRYLAKLYILLPFDSVIILLVIYFKYILANIKEIYGASLVAQR